MSRLIACILLVLSLGTLPVHAQQQDPTTQLEQLLGGGGKASEAELKDAAKQVVIQVSKLRQLEKKRAVDMEVQSKAQIREYVEKRMGEEIEPEELRGQEWALKRLGLLPPDYPLKDKIVALYEEQIAGYYDPFSKKFYIADWIPLAMQTPIMAHELTHALQDQHVDLRPYLTPIENNGDATTARQAVVEGDAVLTMMVYTFASAGLSVDQIGNVSGAIRQSLQLGSSQYPVFASAPLYLRESLMFPYTTGADFALARKRMGGWNKLTEVYDHLPESTEQVIHPEKYQKDPPQAVKLGKMHSGLPRGWKEVHTDVLGEFGLQLLFTRTPGGSKGVQAAAGWDGDRYRAYRSPDDYTVVVHRSTWDTDTDAKEFEQALGVYSGTLTHASPVIERKGKDVVWVIGEADAKTARKLAKAAWK